MDTDLSANHSVNIGIQCDLIDCNSSIVFQKSESCAKQIDGAADRQRHVDMERPTDSARQSPASPGRQEVEPSHVRSVTGATVKSCDRTAKQGDSAQQRADTNNNNTQTCSSPAHAASHADSRTDQADNTLHAHSHLLQRVRTDQHADLAVGLTYSDAQRTTAILSRCTANVSEGTRTVHMTDKQCPLAEVNDAQADNIVTTRTSVDQCIAPVTRQLAEQQPIEFTDGSESDQQPATPGEHTDDEDETGDVDAEPTADNGPPPANDSSEQLNLQTQATDDELAPIIWYLKDGTLPKDNETARKVILRSENFFIKGNQLFFVRHKRRKNNATDRPISEVICVPKRMQPLVLARYHAELMHVGAEKFWLTLRDRVYWRSLYTDVRDYVAQCTVCRQGKANTHPLRPTLQSRKIPDEIFNTLHIDHIKVPKHTKSQKFGYILVLLDALSLNCELVPTVGTTAQETCDAIVTHWLCRYGTFKYLISDRHPAFVSNLTQLLLQAAGVKHIKVAAYHSKGNAACERMNGIILQGLRTYGRNNADWHTALPMIAAGYRASVNPSRGYSPFELMYGQRARLPIESLLSNALPAHERLSTNAKDLANKLGLMRKSAQAAAQASREKATARINKSRNATQLNVRQRVYLRREKVGAHEDHKTAPLFSGPYIITERLAKNVYKLNHLYTGRPVKGPIHADRLRTCTETRARRKPHRTITLIHNGTGNKLRRH